MISKKTRESAEKLKQSTSLLYNMQKLSVINYVKGTCNIKREEWINVVFWFSDCLNLRSDKI